MEHRPTNHKTGLNYSKLTELLSLLCIALYVLRHDMRDADTNYVIFLCISRSLVATVNTCMCSMASPTASICSVEGDGVRVYPAVGWLAHWVTGSDTYPAVGWLAHWVTGCDTYPAG